MSTSLALRLGLAVSALFTTALTASAEYPAQQCTCNNLESLQQDYQNAVYLEGFFRKLSTELEGYEKRDIAAGVSREEIDKFGDKFYADVTGTLMEFPFPTVKGYTGPERVPMPPGTCEQDPVLLDKMAKGSPCNGMADPALVHEFEHRELCKKMGPDVYWSRFASELAAEEADRYKIQANSLKSEIQRVLDVSDVRLRGEWMHTLSGQGVEIVFFYKFDSGKLTTAEQGDSFWTLKGTGTTSNEIVSMKAPGVKCTSSGAVTNEMVVTMGTDGLTFGLELTETNSGGDLAVDCGYGAAMAIPTGEASTGQLAAGLPLTVGDTMIGNAWADQIMALAASEGMSVTGDPTTSLSLSCAAP
jgi:hypothetical protein